MDVSKNRGIPKWMVYTVMEKPIKMDDLGVPLFLEAPIFFSRYYLCSGGEVVYAFLMASMVAPRST